MSKISNIILPSSDADKKAIMSAMVEIDGAMIRAAAERDYVKSSIADLADKYQLDKKHLTKFARLYHKQQFQDNLAEADDFESLVATLVPSVVE